MGEETDRLDLAVAEIAARQHGVVSIAQLQALGMGKNGVTRRVKRGHLHRIHRGVYAVGHRGLSCVPRTIEDLRASSLVPSSTSS